MRTGFASALSRLAQTGRRSVSKVATQPASSDKHPQQLVLGGRQVDRLPASPACPRVDLPLFEDDVDMEVAYDALKQEALRGTPESEVARIPIGHYRRPRRRPIPLNGRYTPRGRSLNGPR